VASQGHHPQRGGELIEAPDGQWRSGVPGRGVPGRNVPARGVLGPAFVALAVAGSIAELEVKSPLLTGLNIAFLTLGLFFARDTRRLISRAFKDNDAAGRKLNTLFQLTVAIVAGWTIALIAALAGFRLSAMWAMWPLLPTPFLLFLLGAMTAERDRVGGHSAGNNRGAPAFGLWTDGPHPRLEPGTLAKTPCDDAIEETLVRGVPARITVPREERN